MLKTCLNHFKPCVNHDDKYSIGFALDKIGIPKIINQNMIYLMISDNLIIPKKI